MLLDEALSAGLEEITEVNAGDSVKILS